MISLVVTVPVMRMTLATRQMGRDMPFEVPRDESMELFVRAASAVQDAQELRAEIKRGGRKEAEAKQAAAGGQQHVLPETDVP